MPIQLKYPLATQTIDDAAANSDTVILATISIVEIIYLIDKGRLVPQSLTRLIRQLKRSDNNFISQDLTEDIAHTLQKIPRVVIPDMPDRIISATALHLNLPLITKDQKI